MSKQAEFGACRETGTAPRSITGQTARESSRGTPCERCGAKDELRWCESQDRAVGYREEAWLCGKCSGGTL